MFRKTLSLSLVFLCVMAAGLSAPGYPGGTPDYVTDTGPFCAGCHAATDADTMRELPAEMREQQLAEKKHYEAIRDGVGPYRRMSEGDRKSLLAEVTQVDKSASVQLAAPGKAKAGETIAVTVTAKGGDGPVIGLMLVDSDLRFQARPVASAGWYVVGEPEITGPDGKPQTKWLDGRHGELPRNLSYVSIDGIEPDVKKKKFTTCTVKWTLRAPADPGEYVLACAFLYGTETGSPHGVRRAAWGDAPAGGNNGASGRVVFSKPLKVEVSGGE